MASITIGDAWGEFFDFAEDPRFLGGMIISYPPRGQGVFSDPLHRNLRLSTADGRFICEISTWEASS